MSSIQFSGIASGIDTASLIDQLIYAESRPVLLMTQKKETYQEQVNAWSDIKTRLTNLNSKISGLQLESNFYAKNVTSNDEDIVTVSASADAMTGTYNINVTSVATATKVESSGRMGTGIDVNAVLNESGLGTSITAGTFSINGVEISVDPETESLNDIVNKVNTNVAGVTASYDSGIDKLTFMSGSDIQLGSGGDTSNFFEATWVSGKSGNNIESSVALGTVQVNDILDAARFGTALNSTATGSFKINGIEINYDTTEDSMSDILRRINTSEANVNATYDPLADKIKLETQETGGISISMEDVSGNFLTATGLLNATQDLGDNAVYSIDEINGGMELTSTSNSIEEVIPGVTFTLNDAGSTKFNITNNNDVTVNKINDFVAQYNSVMGLITSKLAKEAVLQGDASLIRLQSSLRSKTTNEVSDVTGDIDLASEIGLEIDKEGILTLNQSKLKEVLTSSPDKVYDLFNATDGIATRLDVEIDLWTKSSNGIIPTKEESINKQIGYTEESIEKFEERLEAKRALLEKQFAAMESAISSLNSQGSWLSAQLGSLPTWSSSKS